MDCDYDVLADGVVVGRIMKAAAAPVGVPWIWTMLFGLPLADARLRGVARDRDGSVREELAAGVAPMTNHHEEPAPLPALFWAVVFTILLVATVAIFTLVLIR